MSDQPTLFAKSRAIIDTFIFVAGVTLGLVAACSCIELEKGLNLYDSGQFEEARVFFETYLETHPDHPEALYYLGTLEMDGAKSQKYFRTLWINHPIHPFAADALFAICQYHYAKGYYITAGKMFQDLVKNYPESDVADDATYWSALCHLVAQHPDSALFMWQTFLKDYPKSNMYDWAVLGVGDALFALTKYDDACREYRKIVDSPFGEDLKCTALYRLGNCYERLGDSASAQKCYDTIVEQFPHCYERILIKGHVRNEHDSGRRVSETYSLQIGAFVHKENAIKLQNVLSGKGYEVTITSKYKDDGTLLHAVHVGSYSTKEQAQSVAERLEREEGFQPHIVPKKKQ